VNRVSPFWRTVARYIKPQQPQGHAEQAEACDSSARFVRYAPGEEADQEHGDDDGEETLGPSRWVQQATELEPLSRDRQYEKADPPSRRREDRPPAEPQGVAGEPADSPKRHRCGEELGLSAEKDGEDGDQAEARGCDQARAGGLRKTCDESEGSEAR